MKTANSIFKIFLVALLLAVQVHFAYAQTAALLPVAPQQFFDKNGNPVTSGSVGYYIPGTSTPKMVWQDDSQTTPWTNPITLNAGGWPPNNKGIYGNGTYRQIIKDKNNNIISDQPTSATGSGGGSGTSVGDGNSVGTILTWSGMIAPNQYQFAYGQSLSRATYPELYQAITLATDVVCVGGNATLTSITDTSNIPVGAALEGNCIVAGSTVISKTINTVTLSIAANISTTTNVRFFPYGNGNGTTTFNAPDLRGKVIPGRTNMGGVTASNLTNTYYGSNPDAVGANGGTQSSTLAQSNLPNVNFNVSIPSGQGSHNHSYTIANISSATLQPGGASIPYPISASANTGSTTLPALTGTAASGGSGTAFSLVQPSITMNYIIKVTPDTSISGLFGVASIGGMQGVIACGTGITCAGNTISAVAPVPSAGGLFNEVQINNAGLLEGITNSPSGYLLASNGISNKPTFQGFTQNGTGAITRTWSNKVSDIIYAEDFGVTGDGTTDDTANAQKALTYTTANGYALTFKGGTYKLSGLTANRVNGGGIYCQSYCKLIPTTNNVTFVTLSGAVIGTGTKTFRVSGFSIVSNGFTGISFLSEANPQNTVIDNVYLEQLKYAFNFTGDTTSNQWGQVTITNVNQLGTGEWSFAAGDDNHYIFNINVSNVNQQGAPSDNWATATPHGAFFYLRRVVLSNFTNFNILYLNGNGYGALLSGDCQGTFFANGVFSFPSTGFSSIPDTSGNAPNYVYLTNIGIDTPKISGVVTSGNEFAWKMVNVNVTNGTQKNNTGPAVSFSANNYDIDFMNATITNNNQSGVVVNTGAKVRISNLQSTANNGVAGSFYDLDLTSTTYDKVNLSGKNTIGSVHSLVQPVFDGKTAIDTPMINNGLIASNNLFKFLQNDTVTAQGIEAASVVVSDNYADTAPTNGIFSKGALSLGKNGSSNSSILLKGGTSGTITAQTQAAAGTYNWNWPTTAGTSGGPLLSGGGGSNPQTYGTRSGNTTVFGTTSGTLTSGNCAKFDANGNIVDNGSACGGGSGTPGGSNTQVQYNNAGAFGGITGATTNGTTLTLVAPVLGTPASATLTNATGLPISTGVSGLGTGIATALGVNVGTAGSPVINGGALGTPSSGLVTNLTGTANININGTVGATTPTSGAFTTSSASTSISSPLYIGGSGTTGTQLELRSTSGNGTTDAINITGGNNGATTFGTFNATKLNIPQSTASSSSTTGALTITGGAGIGGKLYTGSQIVSGSGILPGPDTISLGTAKLYTDATLGLVILPGTGSVYDQAVVASTGFTTWAIPHATSDNRFNPSNIGSSKFDGQLILTFGTPTIASGACGTGTNGVITSGTNQAGLITIGAAATTSCTITFSTTLAQAPNACILTPQNATAAATGTTLARVSSISTSAWVISGSALASASYYYHCI